MVTSSPLHNSLVEPNARAVNRNDLVAPLPERRHLRSTQTNGGLAMTSNTTIRVVAAGVDAEQMAEIARDAGGGRVEAVAIGDMQGARLVKKGQAHYYLGTCWSGGGGALAAATALLGTQRVGIAGTPGMTASEEKVTQLVRDGKVAFGFPYEQSRTAIPLIIKAILEHADAPDEERQRA
jgi:hypothetical protein